MKKLRILVIRFSSIGDIVLTTPVMRLIKAKYPDCELHFVTKKKFKDVVALNPHIDVLHLLDESLSDCIKELKQSEFDYVIDLHNNFRSKRVRRNVKAGQVAWLNKLDVRKFLYTAFKINRLPDVHITDREVDTLKMLDITNDHKGLEYYISDEDNNKALELTSTLSGGYVAFVIGATYYTKRMPAELIAKIADRLTLPVVLVGGPGDADNAQIIESQCKNNRILNLCSKLPLNVSAGIVKNAALVIAHDTGLMHIAAAYKKEIITIWGNTVPEFGMYACEPGALSADFEVKNLKCRPCSKLGHHHCPKKHFNCMNQQPIDQIVEKANDILTKTLTIQKNV
ncbi:MAG: glycosyltransferase family 9 protein [Bacteroidales bacterium]|nr:glycosyltransferase family 9 protein [Bacteroidales bacterium]